MPGFRVRIDGEEIAAVSTDSLNLLSVSVRGDVVGRDLASVEVSGGYYADDAENTHLIWVDDYELTDQDSVQIEFLESISTATPGKSIEELYPDSAGLGKAPLDLPSLAQELKAIGTELKQKPRMRPGFSLRVIVGNEDPAVFNTKPEDFCFSLSLRWRWVKPQKALLWLSTTTIENIVQQRDGERLLCQDLVFNDTIEFSVGT
mgnify:CR=1 FL=1